jgi:NAD(P)-dependent dehydrogenase (short-subunit alcohol dehydrogenase family)
MKREVLIFGVNGVLGRGITETLLEKGFDRYYLFSSKASSSGFTGNNIELIDTEDLSIEGNASSALKSIETSGDKVLYLCSTIGGYLGGKNFWETTEEEFDKMIDINLKASFNIAKEFALKVRECKAGTICLTAAYSGMIAEVKKAAYSASKAGLIHLVKTISLEGEQINLSINAIAPYIIDTPSNREWLNEKEYEKVMKPREIGELVNSIFGCFHFMTGNIISLTKRMDLNFN